MSNPVQLGSQNSVNSKKSVDLEKSAHDADSSSKELNSVAPDTAYADKSRGVSHIEAIKESMAHVDNGRFVRILFFTSVLVCAWAYVLENSTTYNYSPLVTSEFDRHSLLTTLSIANKITTAICKPFIAKFSDLTSRPIAYILVLVLYVVGFAVTAAAPNITTYIAGDSISNIGSAGVQFLNGLVIADLTPLKWRGFATSMLATPYLINVWFAGLIAQAVLGTNWRWGYGMFAIIMPVAIGPAIIIMLWLDRKAQKEGKISLNAYGQIRQVKDTTWIKTIKNAAIEMDALGLLLLGFGFSLVLLPFSLTEYAKGGWNNPSMIAMIVIGFVLLVVFAVYEIWFCPFPSMPKRIVFNRTFSMAVVIDFFYMFAGNYYSIYFSSYVYVIKTWSVKDWTYFNNSLTLALCFGGVVAGVYMRITHRYKYLQIAGLIFKIIGIACIVRTGTAPPNTASLVMNRVLVGMGGSFSVVGSRVASEASVPHQDLSLVISLLSLWSSIGGAIGSAICAVIWANRTPGNLRKYLPSTINDTQVTAYYQGLTKMHFLPWGSPAREGGIAALVKSMHPLIVIALSLSFIPLIAACFQTNYFLGDQLNAVEGEQPEAYPEQLAHDKLHGKESDATLEKPKSWTDKLADFFNQPLRG